MRSWSISVGRLFGVDVRLHLIFLILPMFVFWTDYTANQQNASGPRNLALAGIILACVAAHECGHMLAARRFGLTPKAVILLPLTGVALYDESRVEKQPAGNWWKREIRLALVGPLVNLALAAIAIAAIGVSGHPVELWAWPFLKAGNLPPSGVGANFYRAGLILLPPSPFDGGRTLRAFLSRTVDLPSATPRAFP